MHAFLSNLLTDRQTDKQTNAFTSSFVGGKYTRKKLTLNGSKIQLLQICTTYQAADADTLHVNTSIADTTAHHLLLDITHRRTLIDRTGGEREGRRKRGEGRR